MLILFKDEEKFNIEDMVDEFVTFFIAGIYERSFNYF